MKKTIALALLSFLTIQASNASKTTDLGESIGKGLRDGVFSTTVAIAYPLLVPFMISGAGQKVEAQRTINDVEVYRMTGEVTPELSERIEVARVELQMNEESEEEVINTLEDLAFKIMK